jgi:membrane associated rhomboid family serine protease
MDFAFVMIPARSERQAMEWSLVLLSQGIEAIIEPPEGEHGWQLAVAEPDLLRARESLRQYQAENRRGPWVRELPWTNLWFDARSVLWMFLLCVLFALSETRGLREAGLMSSQAVQAGQWWRLFTAVMLHADLGHLATNVTTGLLLLGLAMGSFGSGLAVLASYLAGVAGNVAGLLLYGPVHRGLGASGMVLGALGLLTAQSLAYWRAGATPKLLVLRGVASGALLLILLGMNPDADVIAHVAGFLAGLLFGGILVWLPVPPRRQLLANRLAELVCGGLMALTWALALSARGG